MSKSCQQVVSSRINVSIVPNLNCSPAPVKHRVVTTAAAAIGDTSISISLDAAFPAASGAYTAASKYALTPGTILTFGAVQVEVTDTNAGEGVYFIGTTAQVVNVKRLKAAIATAATAETYFAIKLCLKNSNITTNSTQVDNTTNCTGVLFTQITVGYMKMLELGGFMASKDYGYEVLDKLGDDLKAVFYLIDYDSRMSNTGVAQLTALSITEAAVKQLAGWTVQGQIQSVDSKYGSYLTATQLLAANTERSLYGFGSAIDVVTVV
jgi:hypothetical protein